MSKLLQCHWFIFCVGVHNWWIPYTIFPSFLFVCGKNRQFVSANCKLNHSSNNHSWSCQSVVWSTPKAKEHFRIVFGRQKRSFWGIRTGTFYRSTLLWSEMFLKINHTIKSCSIARLWTNTFGALIFKGTRCLGSDELVYIKSVWNRLLWNAYG